MPGADGMSSKFMKNAFVGWTFTAGLYYPPDFDQTKLMPLKHLKPKGPQLMNIRMMFPFTMVCDSCNEYNYTGTKFTAKVEHIKQESYLGMKVYRFYGRCRHCWSEFTFKTDPKNSDYTMESGGKRTYEAWKDADMMEAQLKEERQRDAEQDQMKALEQKSIDVQAEMQRLEDLDAIRTMNKRLGTRDQTIEEALEFLFQRAATADQELPEIDQQELEGFREDQAEQRRRQLDEEVDGNGSSSASGSTASGASAPAVVERARAAVGARLAVKRRLDVEAQAEQRNGAAESSGSSRAPGAVVGAKIAVKRKAEEVEGHAGRSAGQLNAAAESNGSAAADAKVAVRSEAEEGGTVDAKKPRLDAAEAGAAAAAGSGALGLGGYDSSDSS